MSTCPEKDIHSVYLDNELPLAYVAEYEAHLQSCEKCHKELERLKSLRSILKQDSSSLDLTQKQKDESFERLQARLSYSKITKQSNKNVLTLSSDSGKKSYGRYIAAGAAAACALALVLPIKARTELHTNTASQGVSQEVLNAQMASFQPVSRQASITPVNNASFNANLMNTDNQALMPFSSAYMTTFADMDAAEDDFYNGDINAAMLMPITSSNAYSQYANTKSSSIKKLAGYDVFTPVEVSEVEYETESEKKKGFSFKITLEIGK